MARQLPISHLAGTELVEFFKTGLKLSAVKEGETVLVYGDSLTPPHYMAAIMGAAMALGANAVQMVMPSTSPAVQPFAAHTKELGESLMAQAWKAADLVVDMTTSAGQLYSKVTTEALRSGTRVLRLSAPIDDLRRMYPKPEIKTRVLRSREILLAGKQLRVTSDAGTDLVMDKTGRSVSAQYGMADEPGRWTMWNGGQVACAPLENSAQGTLVVNTGDILLPFGRHVADPITCIIKDGRIVEIQGAGLDAFLLRDWFHSWKDPNAYTLAHIGWGCHDGANWHRPALKWLETGGLMDAESYYGNMQIAFGNNISPTLGGKNYSPAHIDIECRNNSFYVDERLIVDRGEFALEELK
jgi:2,5-dihydroxypyridine 5,6-dioxygenase